MNFNQKPNEYNLYKQVTKELINLYGVLLVLSKTEKINTDNNVFGDFSHLKTTELEQYEIYGMPEDTEGWGNIDINFNGGYFNTNETCNVFVARESIENIFDMDGGTTDNKGFGGVIGSLVKLPNGRIMEVTDIDYEVPGVNNLFTQDNLKNVYKLSMKSYNFKNNPDIETSMDNEDYLSLNNYFDELAQQEQDVDIEATTPDTETQKAKVPNVDSAFDRL
jgi:hypothetical protein